MRPAGSPPASTICRCSPRRPSRSRRPIRLLAALDDVDPDSLTPREALEQLYRLKRIAAERAA